MNFWHMQLHPGEFDDWSNADILKILEYSIIGCSGEPVEKFYEIGITDIILIRHGGSVLALVQPIENPRKTKEEEKNKYVWFDHCCKVKILACYDSKSISGEGWYIPKTLMRVDKSNFIATSYIETLYNTFKIHTMIKTAMALLEYKNQLILQGAPGTGKTRLAKMIARNITEPYLLKNLHLKNITNYISEGLLIKTITDYNTFRINRILDSKIKVQPTGSTNEFTVNFSEIVKCFNEAGWNKSVSEFDTSGTGSYIVGIACYIRDVIENPYVKIIQFHPAYSYEDFVRGISVDARDGIIEYRAKNKILAAFAKEAYENYLDSRKEGVELTRESWVIQKLKEYVFDLEKKLNESGRVYFGSTKAYLLRINRLNNNLTYYHDDYLETKNKGFDVSLKKLYDLYNETRISDDPEYNNVDFKGEFRKLIIPLLNDFKCFVGPEPAFTSTSEKKPVQNYILIVDEINRANLPAVLGELIYAMEYRGNSIESMYEIDGNSSIILPPNLYIIGTMNTADRSVGHIDYAIRRRFAFVDVFPDESVITLDLAKEYFREIKSIFEKHIASDFEINQVMLGHSYFLAENKKNLKLKLKYEVLPILQEYFRDGVLNKNDDSLNLLKVLSEKIEGINE